MWTNQYEQMLFEQVTPYLQLLRQQNELVKYDLVKPEARVKYGYWGEALSWDEVVRSYDYLIIMSKEGYAQQQMKQAFMKAFEEHPDALVAYADEDYLGALPEEVTQRFSEEALRDYQFLDTQCYPQEAWLKPEFSPDTLRSFFYFGNIFAIQLKECDRIGVKPLESIAFKDVYSWVLSLPQKKKHFIHIEKILFTNQDMSQVNALAGAEKEYESIKQQYTQPEISKELVSIIIPSKDHPDILARCLQSLVEKTDYPQYECIIVDNGSTQENKAWITKRLQEYQNQSQQSFQYLYEPMPFNFSKMCNLGVNASRGTYLLLLNDDMEISQADWLTKLVEQASHSGTGAVGAKLYYPQSNVIQHAGITNMGIGPAHKLGGLEDNQNYYHGRNLLNHNVLAVTGACLMVSRAKYFSVGGLDETLTVAYNDVDFCFTLYEQGYYNVQRNDVVLFHHESLSRGQEDSKEKKTRLLLEKQRLYQKHPALQGKDPFYHRDLVQWSKDTQYHYHFGYPYEKTAQLTELSQTEQKQLPPKHENKYVRKLTGETLSMLQIDGIDEEEALIIRGWHVVREVDNRFLTKYLLLSSQESGKIYKAKIEPVMRLDVEALFCADENQSPTIGTALSGFQVKLDREALPSGQYKIGVLTTNIPRSWKRMIHQGGKIWTDSLTVLKKN